MSVFVIGDIQGCCASLSQLLKALPWRANDELWLCGDLINRGPQSLETLRLLQKWPRPLRCVLGNHDLAVLAHASGRVGKCGATARQLLEAPDGAELLGWLRRQPLLVDDYGLTMVHAGLAPQWTLKRAKAEARRVEKQLLETDSAGDLFAAMYGNEPKLWSDALAGMERTRFAINALTRLRFVDSEGGLEFENKMSPEATSSTAPELIPWFAHPKRQTEGQPIAFGHWSTLPFNYMAAENVWALDSGCVWGGRLTALQWPERRLFHQRCPNYRQPGASQRHKVSVAT